MLTPREVASAGECSNTGIHQPPSSDAQVPMLTPSEVASAQQCPAQGHSRVSLPFSTRLCKLIGFADIPMISKPVSHPHARPRRFPPAQPGPVLFCVRLSPQTTRSVRIAAKLHPIVGRDSGTKDRHEVFFLFGRVGSIREVL